SPLLYFLFFFQAEDGIRDFHVTGVQTCALPILERRLARFHGREAAMLFSSAYATVVGTLVPLITGETIVISDELNHNCIINAIRLARPLDKVVYRHLDMGELENALRAAVGRARRVVVVTD